MADTTEKDAATPRWVKVAGIIALLLVAIFVVVKVTGLGGSHGPGRHAPAADTSGEHTGPPPSVLHAEP